MKQHFVSPQALQVARYIKRKYKCGSEHLWARSPDDGIFRRGDNEKWFAGIFHVRIRKIVGGDNDARVEILNLRCPPEVVDFIVDKKMVFPGWHMNKRHWITLILDGRMQISDIYALVDNSYVLALKK